MKIERRRIEQILIISLGIIYIIHALTHLAWLAWVLGGLVCIIIALQLPQLRGSTMYLTAFFLILGGGLLLYQKASLAIWIQSASINIAIVTLFVFAPMFGIPVKLPKYVTALKHLYQVKVDTCVVEVYTDNYRTTATNNIYPDPASVNMDVFSIGDLVNLISIDIWKLRSAW